MKVIFLSYSYWPTKFGGELLISVERFEDLVKRGYEISVLTAGVPGQPAHERRNGLDIYRSPIVHTTKAGRAFRRIFFVLWALWHLIGMRFDVLHFGTFPGPNPGINAFIGWMYAQIARIKGARAVYVYSLADTEERVMVLKGLTGFWRRLYYTSLTVVPCVSPRLHEEVAEELNNHNVILLPCGIRDDIFHPVEPNERQTTRDKLGLQPEDVVFTFLGSVNARKGFDVAAEAFQNLSDEFPNWKMVVIGPRSREENQNLSDAEVARVTAPLKDNPNVIYTGRINDRQWLSEIIAASDVFLFPSRREGMGIAPVEAMAAGVPPIIARLPGITDVANIGGETGLFVPPGDAIALQEAMRQLGTSPELRGEMGQKARQRVEDAFNWQQHLDQWESVYQRGTAEWAPTVRASQSPL